MITLLTGENSYEVEQALVQIVSSFDGEPEKLDGTELELRQLPDVLMGGGLFSTKRLVVIRALSANKTLWEALPDWLERISDDIHLVLVEPSPDKRTKTYKALQKAAEVKEFKLWTERDSVMAERWITEEADRMNIQLDKDAVIQLFQRSLLPTERGQPIFDQWQAVHSLEKLAVFDQVTSDTVEQYIDEQPISSVFSIFETALKGDKEALHQLLAELEPREEPFRVFGLLSSQVFQLVTLAAHDEPSAETARAIGVHPYALGKLAPYSKRLTKADLRRITTAFKEADEAMKLSKANPWVLIEQALMKTALRDN